MYLDGAIINDQDIFQNISAHEDVLKMLTTEIINLSAEKNIFIKILSALMSRFSQFSSETSTISIKILSNKIERFKKLDILFLLIYLIFFFFFYFVEDSVYCILHFSANFFYFK